MTKTNTNGSTGSGRVRFQDLSLDTQRILLKKNLFLLGLVELTKRMTRKDFLATMETWKSKNKGPLNEELYILLENIWDFLKKHPEPFADLWSPWDIVYRNDECLWGNIPRNVYEMVVKTGGLFWEKRSQNFSVASEFGPGREGESFDPAPNVSDGWRKTWTYMDMVYIPDSGLQFKFFISEPSRSGTYGVSTDDWKYLYFLPQSFPLCREDSATKNRQLQNGVKMLRLIETIAAFLKKNPLEKKWDQIFRMGFLDGGSHELPKIEVCLHNFGLPLSGKEAAPWALQILAEKSGLVFESVPNE